MSLRPTSDGGGCAYYSPPVAYQTMTKEGPIDWVPATPDLDPGYHTGLSLLAAIEAGGAPEEPAAP